MTKQVLPPLIPGEDIYLKKGEVIEVVKSMYNDDQYYTSNLYTKFIEGVEFAGVFTKPVTPRHRNIRWMRRDALCRVM